MLPPHMARFLNVSTRTKMRLRKIKKQRTKPKYGTLPTSGELRTFCSISSDHGVEESLSFNVLARKIPKNSSGKFRGQLHCLGATHICARGNFLENGPTNILCSYANVGRTMYSTGASNSFRSFKKEEKNRSEQQYNQIKSNTRT